MVKSYNIIPKNGHYEVYVNGKFFCIAKTIPEAELKIKSADKEMTRK